MPKYRVRVERTYKSHGLVEVEAASEDEAADIAEHADATERAFGDRPITQTDEAIVSVEEITGEEA